MFTATMHLSGSSAAHYLSASRRVNFGDRVIDAPLIILIYGDIHAKLPLFNCKMKIHYFIKNTFFFWNMEAHIFPEHRGSVHWGMQAWMQRPNSSRYNWFWTVLTYRVWQDVTATHQFCLETTFKTTRVCNTSHEIHTRIGRQSYICVRRWRCTVSNKREY